MGPGIANHQAGFDVDWVTRMPEGSRDRQAAGPKPQFEGVDPFTAYWDPARGRMEDHAGAWKPQACARSDGSGSL